MRVNLGQRQWLVMAGVIDLDIVECSQFLKEGQIRKRFSHALTCVGGGETTFNRHSKRPCCG